MSLYWAYRILLVPGHGVDAESSRQLTAEDPKKLHSRRLRDLLFPDIL